MIYIRQFRPLNLVIMFILMLSIHFFLMKPIFDAFQLVFVLDNLHQTLLALSFILLAAGGYVINNYYDYETDLQNKPSRVIADKNWLINAYFPITLTGIALAIYVAYRAGLMNLAIIHVIYTFVLWKYAESWKGVAFLGNSLISLLIAGLVLMPGLFEFVGMGVLKSVEPEAFKYLSITLLVYALFSFWSNLCRELVKTLEDQKGDAATGWRTFAVRFGTSKTRQFIWLLFALAMIGLGLVVWHQFNSTDWKPVAYTLFAVVLPFLACVWHFYRSRLTEQYHTLSTWLKIWMLGGISTLPAYFFFFQTN